MLSSTLTALVMSYIQFMSMVGSAADNQDYIDQIPKLFAKDIAKIENGKTIVIGQEQLRDQLNTARTFAYPWTMEILDIVVDSEKNSAAVRFT